MGYLHLENVRTILAMVKCSHCFGKNEKSILTNYYVLCCGNTIAIQLQKYYQVHVIVKLCESRHDADTCVVKTRRCSNSMEQYVEGYLHQGYWMTKR